MDRLGRTKGKKTRRLGLQKGDDFRSQHILSLEDGKPMPGGEDSAASGNDKKNCETQVEETDF